jgi:putative endonuclease
MPHERSLFGSRGESIAAEFLKQRGYKIVERNVRTPHGELDLLCVHRGMVVVVEVKTRASHAYGPPEESVTKTKQRHLIRATQWYVADRSERRPYRIDVVAITALGTPDEEILHLPYAVEAPGGTY